MSENKGELIIYQTEDGLTKIDVRMNNDTVWLTRRQMAELFDRDISVIGRHIRNVFDEDELQEESNVQKMHIANADKPVEFYSLDVIISAECRQCVPRTGGAEGQRRVSKVQTAAEHGAYAGRRSLCSVY